MSSKTSWIYLGLILSPRRQKSLSAKQQPTTSQKMFIVNSQIKTATSIKWLGFNFSLSKNTPKQTPHIKLTIPQSKIRAIENTIKMFRVYNSSPKQNLIFYKIHIRLLVDSWLTDISNINLISKIEAGFLKSSLNLKRTTKHTEIYNHIDLPTIAQRASNLATRLIDKKIIKQEHQLRTILRSRNITVSVGGCSLCANLLQFCAKYPREKINQKIIFDENKFKQWRKMTNKKIAQKTIASKSKI